MSTTSTTPSAEFRLPTDVRPTHYDLTVRTDLENENFDAVVRVDLDIVRPTDTIVLNAAPNVKLGAVSVTAAGLAGPLTPTETAYDAPSERATFKLGQSLQAGTKASLRVAYSSILDGSMMGYYRSKGKMGTYALTQFEPTSARRAVPSWDEPALKATFAVTLVSKAGLVGLSNMPEIANASSEPTDFADAPLYAGVKEGEWSVARFETTPPMSSYLLAWAVGPFTYLESSYKSPISGKVRPLRIYATQDLIHQAHFALEVKEKTLPLYEQMFEVEYPLPKLDTLVAEDFDAGAMENWGLITGRTIAFLIDPKTSDMKAKKTVATVQSHEVAHMWFGNITTMEWWDYLYLNEGFATLMGNVIAVDKVFPEWKFDSEFITEHLNRALRLDAKLSSHPIEVNCPDANQINQIFDSLSYAKAASVLRMLLKYVGEDKFLKGVSIYLKQHLYGNSVSKDLWEGISETTGLDVSKLMDSWVGKMGYPMLTVTETATGIRVRQDRFLEDGPAKPEENATIWTIPLFLFSAGKVDTTAVLGAREAEFEIDTSRPFKLNAGTSGVYRVLYTPARLAAIAHEAAKPGADSAFSLNDRIGLVHDAMALAMAGFLDISAALTLVDIWKNENEFMVWDSMAENVAQVVNTWWENARVVGQLDAFRRKLFSPLVKKLGYEYLESDDADTKQLRTRAIEQAAQAEDPEVIKELQRRFAEYVATQDDKWIPGDLQRITFRTAVYYGGKAEHDAVIGFFENPTTPSMRIAAIRALGASQDDTLISATLGLIPKARDQDVVSFLAGLAANYKSRRLVLEWFEDNFDSIYKRFEGNYTLKYMVMVLLSGLSALHDVKRVEAFYKDKDTSRYNQMLAQGIDSIKAKAAWIERSTDDLARWLEKWEKDNA
ncbi:leucyl aminopeptidase [Dentipellis sp. KUC8613]|nr:leucyl aminopeptidase [Dentipellis sp. KUC8613]